MARWVYRAPRRGVTLTLADNTTAVVWSGAPGVRRVWARTPPPDPELVLVQMPGARGGKPKIIPHVTMIVRDNTGKVISS